MKNYKINYLNYYKLFRPVVIYKLFIVKELFVAWSRLLIK